MRTQEIQINSHHDVGRYFYTNDTSCSVSFAPPTETAQMMVHFGHFKLDSPRHLAWIKFTFMMNLCEILRTGQLKIQFLVFRLGETHSIINIHKNEVVVLVMRILSIGRCRFKFNTEPA